MSRALIVSVLFSCVLSAVVSGQCIGDDGFAPVPGACCVPAVPALPVFPGWFMFADGACFRDCSLELQFPLQVNLSVPFPVFNDVYVTQMTVVGAVSLAPTFVVMKYQRTWTQPGTTGALSQVWRFLINVDVNYLPPLAPPCPTPACTPAPTWIPSIPACTARPAANTTPTPSRSSSATSSASAATATTCARSCASRC